MKMISTGILALLVIPVVINLTSCINSNAESTSQPVENKVQQEQTVSNTTAFESESKIQAELDKAKAEGKAVFVVVTGNEATETDKAVAIADEAKSIYKNALVVKMDRDDAANAALVNEWRLAGAPLPLILVVSPKGVLAGGRILDQATSENIASLVPSPKLEKVYEAIGNNKHAIVAFTKKSFTDRQEVLKECNEAVSELKNEAVMVEVDMDDKMEKGFMEQVRIDPATLSASVTLVINNQGQVAGTSTTIPDSEKLVAAAKTPVQSGCGPGCGPAGCEQ